MAQRVKIVLQWSIILKGMSTFRPTTTMGLDHTLGTCLPMRNIKVPSIKQAWLERRFKEASLDDELCLRDSQNGAFL